MLLRERVALTALLATIVLLGLCPAPLVRELERAGSELLGVPADGLGGAGHGGSDAAPAAVDAL